jgi:hypothetical protein
MPPLALLRTGGEFCRQGQDTEIAQTKIVKTYWHDHSVESSWGALSDGTISFPIQPFSGMHFLKFFKKPPSLKS